MLAALGLKALALLKQADFRADIVNKLNQHAMSLIEGISALSPEFNTEAPDPNDAASAAAEPQQLLRPVQNAQRAHHSLASLFR